MKRRILHLDIENIKVDQNGVKDFFWPVSYSERQFFADQLMQGYTSLIQKHQNSPQILSYKVLYKYYVTEALAVFNCDLLKKRLESNSYQPILKKEMRVWGALLNDERPEDPGFLNVFRNGPARAKKSSFLKKIKRLSKLINMKQAGLNVGSLKLKPITKSVLLNDIIATQRTDLIQKHANTVSQDVVFCRSDRWFSGLNPQEINQELRNMDETFETSVMNIVSKLYKEHGIEFSGPSFLYLQNILSEGSACVRAHYKKLLSVQPDSLPKTVWTGTAGYIWDILLRSAVLEVHKGHVTGHDHGAGLGHVSNPCMGSNELWHCSAFVCLNKNQASEMEDRTASWYCFDHQPPQLSYVPDTQSEEKEFVSYERFLVERPNIKTIIVLATLYGGDRVWMGPCSPDIVHLDWQARVVFKLRSWGYNVIVKIHPETPIMPPQIIKDLGASIRSEPLEDMMEEGDLILFDCLYTTVFRSVVSSNLPMVMIDFYNHPWTEKGLNLIEKRAGFVKGSFDEKNREAVNWSELKTAIDTASSKHNNKEFFNYYYA